MTSQKNSFKAIDEEQMSNFSLMSSSVEKNVNGSLGVFGIVGNMINMYLPRLIQFFVHLVGGEEQHTSRSAQSIDGEAISDGE